MAQNETQNTGQYHQAKQWEIALFSLNNSASNLYLLAFGFLTYYATGPVGLTTLIVGNVLGAVRLFDGLIDPTIGVIMDKIDTKWGRFRPIMLLSNLALILSFIILFNTHQFTGAMRIAVLAFALIFHKIAYSFQQTVTKAAQPALTNDPKQRPLFSIYDTIFSSMGVFALGQYLISNFLAPRHGNEFNLAFFGELITIVCVISLIITILAMIGIARKDKKEFFGLGEGGVETKSFSDYWSIIKGNRPLQILAINGAVTKFMSMLIADQAFLVILFGILLGNYALSGQMSLIQIVFNLLIVIVLTRIATRTDLKTTYTISTVANIISISIMTAILLMAGSPTEIFANGILTSFPSILFTAAYIGMRVFSSYPTSIVLTMAADITDYETARSGRFVSGLIGTVFSLTDSIASALVPIIIGIVIAGAGFPDAYPDASQPLTEGLFTAGIIILAVIPLALLIISLILIRLYPLDRQAMEQVQQTINERRREGELASKDAEPSEVQDVVDPLE
jgi:Na+/melibiose symporter-like transporter